MSRQVADLSASLSATANSELEKLLVDRICLSWIEVNYATIDPGGSPCREWLGRHCFNPASAETA